MTFANGSVWRQRRFIAAVLWGVASPTPSLAFYYVETATTLEAGFSAQTEVKTTTFQQTNGVTSYEIALNSVSSPLGASASASSSANLADGTVRLSGGAFSGNQGARGHGLSIAQIIDTVTFSLPAGMASAAVIFEFLIEGSLSGMAPINDPAGSQTWRTEGFLTIDQALYACDFCAPVLQPDQAVPGKVDAIFAGTIAVPVVVTSGASYAVGGYLSSFCTAQNASCSFDLLNTGRLGLGLPSGVTFSSQSGVFLTSNEVAVPEPGSLALLGLGVAGLGLSRRRKA